MTARSQYLQESTVKYSATAPALLKDVSLDCDPQVISQLAGADGSAWEAECRKPTEMSRAPCPQREDQALRAPGASDVPLHAGTVTERCRHQQVTPHTTPLAPFSCPSARKPDWEGKPKSILSDCH